MKIALHDARTLRLSFRFHAATVAFAKSLVGGEYDKRSKDWLVPLCHLRTILERFPTAEVEDQATVIEARYELCRITPSAFAFSRIAISRTAVLLIPNLAAIASSKQRGEMELSTPPLTNLTLPCRANRTVPDPALPDQIIPSLKRFWRHRYYSIQEYFMQSNGGEVKGRLS